MFKTDMKYIENYHTNEKFQLNKNLTLKTLLEDINDTDFIYRDLLIKILREGKWKQNRTGTKTISIFGEQLRFKNVGEKFPILTTKKIHYKSVLGELLWFLDGKMNKHLLKEKYGVSIWDEWGNDETGELGPVYGAQWNNWNNEGINQLENLIDTLRNDPDDRRMLVTAWNPSKIKDMALPPCHWSYQAYSEILEDGKRKLHLMFNMRSLDVFLGMPFDVASYATLLIMLAQQTDHIPGDLIMNTGDTHLYENHISYVLEQITRTSKDEEPKLIVEKQSTLWDYKPEHFKLINYNTHPNWKNVPVAV